MQKNVSNVMYEHTENKSTVQSPFVLWGKNNVIQITLLNFKNKFQSVFQSHKNSIKAVLFTFEEMENSAEISFSISPLIPPSPNEIFIWKVSADAKVIA